MQVLNPVVVVIIIAPLINAYYFHFNNTKKTSSHQFYMLHLSLSKYFKNKNEKKKYIIASKIKKNTFIKGIYLCGQQVCNKKL